MKEIKEWLESPSDYATGKYLYNSYAPRFKKNDILAGQINSFQNRFTFNLLKSELEAILALIPTPSAKATRNSAKHHTVGQITDLPEDLAIVSKQIPLLFKRRDQLRYKSREMDPGDKLREIAFEIVDLDLQIRKNYRVLDFFERTGNYPPGYLEPEAYAESERDKFVFWLKAMRASPSWISRNKDNPDKVDELQTKRQVMADIDKFLIDADNKE